MSDERKAPEETSSYASERISKIQERLSNAKTTVISAIRKVFRLPDRKKVYTAQIEKAVKPSIMKKLRLAREKADKENAARSAVSLKRNNKDLER